MERTPYITPRFPEIEPYFRGELSEKSYLQLCAKLEALAGVVVNRMTYPSAGLRVTGIEVLPAFGADETGPLILFNRGGSRDFGALSVPQIVNLMAPLATQMRAGVLASNYRGNAGGEGREEFGGADVDDILALLEIGKTQPWWDGKHVFLFGWSRGGMMTYLTLKTGFAVNAAAVGAGIADLRESVAARPEMDALLAQLIPQYLERKEAALAERSAVCWPEKIQAPLLLLHGDADRRVSIDQARALYALLTAQGSKVRLREFAGGGHGLMSENAAVMDAVGEWFTQHLLT